MVRRRSVKPECAGSIPAAPAHSVQSPVSSLQSPVLSQSIDWRLETGNWRLATGNWGLETGDWGREKCVFGRAARFRSSKPARWVRLPQDTLGDWLIGKPPGFEPGAMKVRILLPELEVGRIANPSNSERWCSSNWQSNGLLIRTLWVRLPPPALGSFKFQVSSSKFQAPRSRFQLET